MNERGFTLLEVLVVGVIIGLISTSLISNFSQGRMGLNRTVAEMAAAIRTAPARALAGALHNGVYPCGYGVTMGADSYSIYAGPEADGTDCTGQNHNYESSVDTIVETRAISYKNVEIVLPVEDIFFVPPNPKTYINNVNTTGVDTTISVRIKGESCPSESCRSIYVSTSGNIELQ